MTRQFATKFRAGADDAGFVLVEVLVSAALLVLVGLSVFNTLTQSDRLAEQQGRRAMAANMAQAELERIRSLPIEDVANLKGTKTLTPDPTRPADRYYVTSSSKWVTDGKDEPDCTTRSGGLDYMRITTMVAWGVHARAKDNDELKKGLVKPVVLSSIVTPAARASSKTNGSLSVNVKRADATTGVSNLNVTITPKDPGTTYSDVTNENGCVVFPFVESGAYTLTFSRTNWVDQNSRNQIEDPVSVPPGATNKVGYLYDLAGTTSTNFTTSTKGFLNLLGDTRPSKPRSLVIYNPDQTSGPIVETINANESGTKTDWNLPRKPLFPSETPYTLYTGACQENRPPAQYLTNVNITAGAYQNAGPTRLPAYDIRVLNGASPALTNAAVPGAKVTFYPGCGDTYTRYTKLGATNWLLDGSAGRLEDPGFPYTLSGTVCVSGLIGGTRYRLMIPNTPNTTFDNPPIRDVYLKSGIAGGAECTE